MTITLEQNQIKPVLNVQSTPNQPGCDLARKRIRKKYYFVTKNKCV